MKPRKRQPSWMALLALALLALAPLLAVLQYRWLTEVSQAESQRMRANLENSVAQFSRDFDHELSAAYLMFQSDPLNDRGIAASYRQWRETAQRPQLVSAVFQTRASANGQCDLLKFNETAGSFEPAEWPQALLTLRDALLRRQLHQTQAEDFLFNTMDVFKRRQINASGPNTTQVRIQQTVRPALIQASIRSVDPDIPALIIPVFTPDAAGASAFSLPLSQRIVMLDESYLKQDLIPTLLRRHFAQGSGNEYNIAITKRGDPRVVVYESTPGISAAGGEITGELMKLRLNDASPMIFTKHSTPDEPRAAGSPHSKAGEPRRAASIILQSDINIGASEAGKAGVEGAPMLKLIDNGGWRIAVRHRAGSLEAAVASVRRRNLAISFGILLLLGSSVGFIVLSSRRAQALAERQMEFVAGVSHELRTPLAVICSAGENLADGVIDNRDQIKRYGGLIRDEGRRLTGMVEQALEFAGVQSGRRSYELQPVELRRVIEEAIAACRLRLSEGGFALEQQMPATMLMVKADAAALSRAIQNLLSNAMKYSGDSRWIGLSVDTVKTDRGEEVRIRVSDRGIGITPPELPHIFEPFYRGSDVTAAQIHGNGLGLSLVKHIIEAHNGRVNVESKPRQGTAFTLQLPIESVSDTPCQ